MSHDQRGREYGNLRKIFRLFFLVDHQSQLSASKRHDPLSVYVDAMEDQFEN